jgi:hypothetical protein
MGGAFASLACLARQIFLNSFCETIPWLVSKGRWLRFFGTSSVGVIEIERIPFPLPELFQAFLREGLVQSR